MNESLVVVDDLHPVLTARSWNLPEGMPVEEWVALGKKLVSAEKNVQWALGTWWIYGERTYGDGRTLAEQVGIGYGTVRNYASVVRTFEMSRRNDNLTFGHHQAVAALPPPQQDRWLDQAEREELSVVQLRRAVRRQAAAAKTTAIGFDAKALGKFSVIYADPPWQYERQNPQPDSEIEFHYPTMPLDDICALSVADIAHDDAILFLWVPAPLIQQGLQVTNVWGFSYRTSMVWVKNRAGVGFWVRQRHELLLIGRRGNMPTPPYAARPDSVIEAPRLEHSAKPPAVRDIIDRMYPGLEKIELFARAPDPREGWDVWGNVTRIICSARTKKARTLEGPSGL